MASNVDIEILAADIETFLKANLNTKISAISSEKNDSISLSTIDSAAYFFQSMDEKVANYDPFVLYGVVEMPISDPVMGCANLKGLTYQVIICMVDNKNDATKDKSKRALRYSRCLEELFASNYDKIHYGYKFYAQTLTPVPFTDLNSSRNYIAVGLNLRVNLG